MSMTIPWIVMALYFILVMGFGSMFGRYTKSTADFFFGGRRFSWWLIAMSILATGVGSHSFVKYSAKAFQHGFSSTMTYMNDWFFMPFFMFGWLPLIYYSRVSSVPEYFERRFDYKARFLATIALFFYMIGYISIGFLTIGKALQPMLPDFLNILGMNFNLHGDAGLMNIIIFTAVITGIYITYGGQTAVIFTDLLQGFILIFAGLLVLFLGFSYLGGFESFWHHLPTHFKLPLAHFNQPGGFNFVGIFWQDGIAGSIGFLFMNQGLIMRFLATRSVNDGKKAAAFNVLIILPISAIVVSGAGWIGHAIYQGQGIIPGIPAGIIPMNLDVDEIFTIASKIVATPLVFGFIMAAVTAALMSTVDTLINATAAIFINDIWLPAEKVLIRRSKGSRLQQDDKYYLKVARWSSIVITAIGVVGVLAFKNFATLYEAHGFFHSTLTPPLIVAIFLGIFWKRFTTSAVLWTFLGGSTLMIVGATWPEIFIRPFAQGSAMSGGKYIYISALYNILVCVGVGVIVSFFTKQKTEEELDGLTIWSVDRARWKFKGGKPNDRPGEKVKLRYKIDDSGELARFAVVDMDRMGMDQDDLVYLCDSRAWLGGLKSVHTRAGKPHQEPGVVYITSALEETALFNIKSIVVAEKEM
ncbi:MAG: sodium:proline symporter [Candidatus Marinimicrobia bacterium CG1_02_48_14]|nr:MAG: sodium:proline symporter [Candidatus Marinimicrobia bacterium CG1_02_48_14]